MISTLASAALICAASLLVGQTVCLAAGFERFTWTAPAVGFSVLMLISSTALHVPGRAATTAVVCLLAAIACGVLVFRRASRRPAASGVLIGVLAGVAALIPFVVNGRFGTFGWSFYNDMSVHLLWADAFRSQAIAAINALPTSYPLGPHALVATVSQGIGAGVDDGFNGYQVAVVVITAWTALAALERMPWWGRAVVAVITANSFLLASYFGEGAFKETTMAMLVLAFALGLRALIYERLWRPFSLLPLALLVACALDTYSYTGVIWPAASVAILAAGLAIYAAPRWRSVRREALTRVRDGALALAAPVLIAVGIGVVVLIPEIPRLAHFFNETASTGTIHGIATNNLGDLVQPLSGWEAFGIWLNHDFRFLPVNQLHQGMWTALAVAVVAYGVLWWIVRRDFVLPAAALASLFIFVIAKRHQSPYVVAKALVILSPLLFVLAGRALLDWRTPPRPPRGLRLLSLGVAALFFAACAVSSYEAMRFTIVGSKTHAEELSSFQPLLRNKSVLFLGADDFIDWELADARVASLWNGTGPGHTPPSSAVIAVRPEKPWTPEQTIDFDTIEPSSYEQFEYVIAPRDGRLSSPPTNLVLVRRTRDYDLFRRVGPTPPRRILDEGQEPGTVLRCNTAAGKRIARMHGVAALREPPMLVALPVLAPGLTYGFSIDLPAGRWKLTMPYFSAQPMTLSMLGRRVALPAALDRPGAGWPAGEVELSGASRVQFTLKVHSTAISGYNQPTYANALFANRAQPDTIVPLARACGKYVDWYLPS